ncbi:hypothetical protein L195_g021102 [Trifolium pratense]|uniref:Uncharacterized protein n=1 Tax=Trifolium pratense TaxID=57577 RepID=A0A2K3N4B5_TRIPR|nr:hypothetical protein L195_g021102 [Trifolium pratense]
MMRTRLLWFGVGFTASAAVVSHFIWKDLWVDRHALSSHITHQFDALQTRISNLESTLPNQNPVSNHDQGRLVILVAVRGCVENSILDEI